MSNQKILPKFKYVDSENKFAAYTNHTGVSLTNFDVRILFGQLEAKMDQAQTPPGQAQELTVINQGVVTMSPLHAKIFCENLKLNMEKYETMFGKITMPTTPISAPEK